MVTAMVSMRLSTPSRPTICAPKIFFPSAAKISLRNSGVAPG